MEKTRPESQAYTHCDYPTVEKCHQEPKEVCQDVPHKSCGLVVETQTFPELYNDCVPTTRTVCKSVPKENCKFTVVITGFKKIPNTKCETVCKNVPKEKCEKTSKEVCAPTTVSMPIVFPEQVCQRMTEAELAARAAEEVVQDPWEDFAHEAKTGEDEEASTDIEDDLYDGEDYFGGFDEE